MATSAFEVLCQAKPQLRNAMYQKIFMRTLPFFSRSLHNIDRDWNKVGRYTKHLGIIDDKFDVTKCYTNDFLPEKPHTNLEPIACCIEE